MAGANQEVLSQDLVFDLLSNPRRRFVLYYLRRQDGPVELRELADAVAAWENETDVEELTSQQRKRVYVSLYQTHVPKLEEAGLIEYDSEEGVVTLAERSEELGAFLGGDEREVPWQYVYLLLAAVAGLVYGATAAGIGPFAAISTVSVAVATITAFAAAALFQYLYERRSGDGIFRELVRTDSDEGDERSRGRRR